MSKDWRDNEKNRKTFFNVLCFLFFNQNSLSIFYVLIRQILRNTINRRLSLVFDYLKLNIKFSQLISFKSVPKKAIIVSRT